MQTTRRIDESVPGDLGPERAVRVAVAVAVHNRRELTVRCLRDLTFSDTAGIDLSIFVYDDGSTDGTAAVIQQDFPGVTLLHGDGKSFYTRGTNRAIAAALQSTPDYVLAINDDVHLPRDLLQQLVRCARDHPRSIVGPALVRWDCPEAVFQVAPEWQLSYGGWRHRLGLTVADLPADPFDVELVVGNCVLVPKEAIADVGLMDERNSPAVHGDGTWTARMRRSGWRLLIEPKARLPCQPNTVPPTLRGAGGRAALRALLGKPRHGHNIPALLASRMAAAPTPAEGIAAFAVQVIRLALRALGLGRWPRLPDRPFHGSAAEEDITQVVLAWPYLEWGGVQVLLSAIASALPEQIAVRAVVPRGTDPGLIAYLRGAGIALTTAGPAIDLRPARSPAAKLRRRIHDAFAHVALARAIARVANRGTVLHVDLSPWSSFMLVRWLAKRRPVVQSVHTSPGQLSTARRLLWQSKLIALCRHPTYRLVASNGDIAHAMAGLVHGRAPIPVAPTPFDPAVLDGLAGASAAKARQRLSIPGDAPLVVGVGQLIHRKGIDVLVEAMATIKDEHPDARAIWVGDGAERAAIETRLHASGLAGTLTLVPAPSVRQDLFALTAAATVYVQPSREEGVPMALLDAMALGLPVVASRVNAVPEAVIDDVTGVLIPRGDPDALASAISGLLDDPGRSRRLGQAAAEFVRRHHDLGATVDVVTGVYRDALGAARRQR